ncbi:MAG: Ig-like domain-containing protein, partial [Gammaproteobacteria bacterium]|nr:Ig-like domain-containing protein [Gammaproteobacteria bacterium]
MTLTVNGLTTGQEVSIDFTDTGRTASAADFEVYQQATEPTGSDTPVTLDDSEGYYYYIFATNSDPAGPVTFWVLAKTDTVFLEPDETLFVKGGMYDSTTIDLITESSEVRVTLTDATPIPDPTGKPTTPANFTATPGRGAVTLTWDAIDITSSNTNRVNDLNITKHQYRQSTDGEISDETWTDIPDSGYGEENAASYTIRGLIDDTEYTFQLRAVNGCAATTGCGESDPATAAAWPHSPDRYRISTIAGGVGDGGLATAARFEEPSGLAADGSGNFYFCDLRGDRIRKVDSSGVITTVTRASIPRGVLVDGSGNLYIADSGNRVVRKVDSSGVGTTVAGTGSQIGAVGDDGPATEATLVFPVDLALDGSGNLYIADNGNHRVRKVDSSGTITTVAGTGAGTGGFSGDGGQAAAAELNFPTGVAVDGSGNVYIADTRCHRVRKVDTSGVITKVAGVGTRGIGGDGGPATSAQVEWPVEIELDGSGNLYISQSKNERIRKVDSSGIITTVARGDLNSAGDGGPATAALLDEPSEVAVDGRGNLYIADAENFRIRKVDSAGIITTVAGVGTQGFSGDGGPATAAQFNRPIGVALDRAGNLYIADASLRVRKVDSSGVITTFAGSGTRGFGGDGGPATAAQIDSPRDVALDTAGNLYIADANNHRIRKVDSSGVITTVAGTGTAGFGVDGGPATGTLINEPQDVAVDRAGNLYIAERVVHRIRKVGTNGLIATIAGTGRRGFSGDGGPATSARLYEPRGIAVDRAGNLYIADTLNRRIRKLTPPPPPLPPRPPSRPNRHPTVTLSCAPCEVERGGESMLTATASDPDGDPLTYSWSASDGVITGSDDTAVVRWTAPDRVGTVTIRVRVSDGRGGRESARADIEVLTVLPERTPFDVADRGTATFTTGGQADSPRVGYGLIRADGGMATPSGIALFQFRDADGVLITEASVPAAAPVR